MLPTHETILILACHDVLPVFLPFEFVCSISATHRGIAREEGSALGHFRQEGNGRVRGFPNHDAADHASSLTNGGHETLEPDHGRATGPRDDHDARRSGYRLDQRHLSQPRSAYDDGVVAPS